MRLRRSPFRPSIGLNVLGETNRERRIGLAMGLFWSCLWLFWLIEPFLNAVRLNSGAERAFFGGSVLVFILLYIVHFITRSIVFSDNADSVDKVAVMELTVLGVLRYVGLWILVAVMIAGVGQSASAGIVFAAISALWTFHWRVALTVVALAAGGYVLAMATVPGWHFEYGSLLGLGFATVAVSAAQLAARRQRSLAAARIENAQLAVQAERNRMARDLHDILGHSLTVIAIKAELAGRLLEVDPQRARAEVADLERLSRSALADVRGAVEGFREISLAGELSRAKSALGAAGIAATVPSAVDEVPEDLREVFAWTVREAVTNVLRHSGATSCSISVDKNGITVQDNGVGSESVIGGAGLIGLRERARLAGTRLQISAAEPHGVVLRMAGGEQS